MRNFATTKDGWVFYSILITVIVTMVWGMYSFWNNLDPNDPIWEQMELNQKGITKVEIDGHLYYKTSGVDGGNSSLTHAEACPCKTPQKSKGEIDY